MAFACNDCGKYYPINATGQVTEKIDLDLFDS